MVMLILDVTTYHNNIGNCMKGNSVVSTTLCALLSGGAIAGSMGPVAMQNTVMTLTVGPAWQNGGMSQTLYLANGIEKRYISDDKTRALAFGELFYGYEHTINSLLMAQFGVAAAVTSDATLSGDIWDDGDVRFDNLAYSYKVNHARVAVKAKLLGHNSGKVMPYISGSIGVGINRAHEFSNTPKIFEAVPNANFTGRTKASLAYTLGVGMERVLNDYWRVGAGYEFADWGKSQLGAAFGQTTGRGLALNHLYTNGFALSASVKG